ncbi:hypothetical protein [Rothia halotolerans]|uniref:hypothetical protein n=1 Tax=Rothia halotolerans TaxID=405770 RepID=UPI00101DD620|nr:hypothetical protein [Rothia halotolerans]
MHQVATPAAVRQHSKRHHNLHTVKGIHWRAIRPQDTPGIERLVRRQPFRHPTWTLEEGTLGIAAYVRCGTLLATVLVTHGRTPGEYASLFTVVAVDPDWREEGLGLVGLNLIPQFLANDGIAVDMLFGLCSSKSASYYLQAGYEVTRPREQLKVPGVSQPMLSPDPARSCWFYRHFI